MTDANQNDLAILGGSPAFDEPLHVGRPNIGDRRRFSDRVEEILDRRRLTNDGPYQLDFEERVARITGTRNCVAVCNGTVALEIMARATGMADEVIIPSFTFVATAHALQWQEIRPSFCDIDPKTHCIDPGRVEELITPQTSAIIGVHLWGSPCDVEALAEIADRRNLVLAYDASHAFGARFGGQPIGRFGRASTLSFHATKICNCLEGGAIITDDDALADRMRLMRNFGFSGRDNVIYLGSNGKMNEISAAMGVTSIESLDRFIEHNRAIFEVYRRELEGLAGIHLVSHDPRNTSNYHYVVLEVDEAHAGLSRDTILRALEAENILARRYFMPGAHAMEPYRLNQPLAPRVLPETIALSQRVLSLPTGEATSEKDAVLICDRLRLIIEAGPSVYAALANQR